MPCEVIVSRYCAPIAATGFSAFIALCMTTDRFFHRSTFSLLSVIVTRFWPRKSTAPEVMAAGGLSSRAIANSRVDFPQPDSPTTPTNSPGATSRSTLSTASTGPLSVPYSTLRLRTSSTRSLGTTPPHRSQRGVADLVEGVVHQREGRAEQGDAQAGRDRPQRRAGLQRLLVLRPVQHRSPADRARVSEAQELQPGGGEHRVQRRAQEVRDDQRDHRRQDLDDDDVRA